jgi:hypothetical protein
MERASVEHRRFRALGSRFQPTYAIAQVLKRPVMSFLVEGQSSLAGHVRIRLYINVLHAILFLPSDGQVLAIITGLQH